MGKFIVSRSVAGDRFVLQSAAGWTLAVSRDYATLDACKKGIASLIVNAPAVPVRDLTAGERGPNPKFELTGEEGAFFFVLKSANGKAVITSTAYATKKACLRAIAMLRAGVADYEILFQRKGALVPLSMKRPDGAAVRPCVNTGVVESTQAPVVAACMPKAEEPLPEAEAIFLETEEIASETEEIAPEAEEPPARGGEGAAFAAKGAPAPSLAAPKAAPRKPVSVGAKSSVIAGSRPLPSEKGKKHAPQKKRSLLEQLLRKAIRKL